MQSSSLILVVDDHPINRRLLQAQLAAEGWQSEVLATGTETLRWLTHSRPMLVVIDYLLEDMTGIELLQRVRQWEAGFHETIPIPLVLYSGMPQDYLQAEAHGLDFSAIMTKPISRIHLRQTLAPLLSPCMPPIRPTTCQPVEMPDDLLMDLVQFGYQQLARLRISIANGQLAEAKRIAHSLRGAAAVLQEKEIAQSAAEVENQIRVGMSNHLDEAYDRLQIALGRLDLQRQEAIRLKDS